METCETGVFSRECVRLTYQRKGPCVSTKPDGRARLLAARLFAAFLLLCAGLSLTAAPVEAQRRLSFISNEDTPGQGGFWRVSNSRSGISGVVVTQFTTGTYPVEVGEGGFIPRRLTLWFGDNTSENIPSSDFSVVIWRNNNSNNDPLNSYIPLANPSDLGGNGAQVFTYNGNSDLGRNAKYHIVVQFNRSPSSGTRVSVQGTSTVNVNEDDTLEGWSMGNAHRGQPGSWSNHVGGSRLQFKLEGITKNIEPTGDLELFGVFRSLSLAGARIGTLEDANGLPEDPSGYSWEMLRYDSADDDDPDGVRISGGFEETSRFLGDAEEGKRLAFRVTYTDQHGHEEVVESDLSPVVLAADATLVTVAPKSPTAISNRGVPFVLTRTGSTSAALTVGLSWGGDLNGYRRYADRPLEATFDPGASTVEVSIQGSSQEPGDGADIELTVEPGSGYAVGEPATATVRAIGPPVVARLALAPGQADTVLEGESVDLVATLYEPGGTTNVVPAGENFTMNFDFAMPSVCGISDNAASTADYAGDGTGSVDFMTGDTSKTFTLRTLVDSDTTEGDERVCAQINNSEPRSAFITYSAEAAVTLTIRNVANANLPVVTVAPQKARVKGGTGAGSENAMFTLTRTGGDMSTELTVDIVVSGSGPQATEVAANTMATFQASMATTEVSIGSQTIAAGDPDQNVILTIQPGAAYTLGTPSVATVVTTAATNQPATGMPSIVGTAEVGQTLTAGVGTIDDPDGNTPTAVAGFTWQWEREDSPGAWTPISGATAYRYTLAAADMDKKVRVTASYTDSGTGFPESRTSAPTATVSAAGAQSEVSVRHNGNVRSGEDAVFTLTRTAPTAGALTVNIRISGNGVQGSVPRDETATFLAGAATVLVSVPTVTLAPGDGSRGAALRVLRGTGYDIGSSIEDRASLFVLEPLNQASTGEGVLTGTAEVGQVLTVAPGTIDDPDGLGTPTYTYKWVRVAPGTSTENEFLTTTEPTYTLTTADLGFNILVSLEFDDALGFREARSSNSIGPVVASGDAEPLPVISVRARQSSVISTRQVIFVLTRTGSPAAALTVDISMGGMNNAYQDYAGRPTQAVFAAGASTTEVSVPSRGQDVGDFLNMELTVSPGSGYVVDTSGDSARVRVTGPSAEARIALAQGQPDTVNEGGTIRFTATLYTVRTNTPAPATEDFTMNYRFLNASPCSISNIASAADIAGDGTGSVDFRVGDTTKNFEIRTLIDSDTTEGDERICADIAGPVSSPSGAFRTYSGGGQVAATIRDVNPDTFPVVTVSAASTTVDVAPNAAAVFTFSRTASTTNPLVVDFSVAPTGVLENAPPASVTIGAGQAEAELRLPVTALENEVGTVSLGIDDPSDNRYTVGASPGNAATVTVRGPVVPVLSIHPPSPASVSEGEGITFTVRLSAPAAVPFTVSYRLDSTSQASAQDISGSGSGTVSFAAGETEKTFTITTLLDRNTEGEETLAIALGLANPAGAALQGDAVESLARATIRDVRTPVISVRHGGNVYGGQNVEFTLSRTESPAAALTVNIEVTGNGAVTSPAPPSTATFSAGRATAQVSVPTVAVAVGAAARTVTLTLQGGAGYRVISGGAGSRASSRVRGRPANQPATGEALLSGAPEAGQVLTAAPGSIDDANGLTSPGYTYRWSRVRSGGAGAEVIEETNSPTYTMTSADVGHWVEVTLLFNDDFGYPEARSSNRIGPVRPSTAPITPVVTVLAEAPSVANDSNAVFSLTRTARDVSAALTVSLRVSGAGAGSEPPTGATFAAGSATTQVTVATNAIASGGADQSLTLTVQGGVGYTVGTPAAATVTVLAPENNPATGAPSLTGTAQVGETLTAGIGNISDLDDPPGEAEIRFSWSREIDPGVWAAIAGANTSTYLLTDDDEGKRVRVTASFDDDVSDVLESVVSAPTLTVVATGAEALPQVSVAVESTTVNSGQDAAFVFTRTGETTGALDVSYNISDPDGVLTVNVPGSATIQAGSSEVRVAFPTLVGANQRATITAFVGHGVGRYDFGTPVSATVTASGPVVPTVGIHPPDPASATEGDDLVFTLRLSSIARGAFTVSYRLDANSRATAADIQGTGTGTVSFSAGDRMQTFTVTTLNDNLDEDSETIAFVLGAPSDADVALPGTPTRAEARINDVVNTVATGAPTITGTLRAGETLTADTTGILDDNGLTRARAGDAGYAFRYQWRRTDADGTNAVEIRGATAANYVLTGAEHRKRVLVTVRFNDDDDYPEAVTSASSDVVLDDAAVTAEMARDKAATETLLDRFGTAVVAQVFDSVKMRFDAPRTPGVQATLAGYRIAGTGARGAGVRGAGVRGVGVRGAGARGAGVRGAGVRGAGVRGAAAAPGHSGASLRGAAAPGAPVSGVLAFAPGGAPVSGAASAAAASELYAGGFGFGSGPSFSAGQAPGAAGLPGLADGVDLVGGMEFGGAGTSATGAGLAGVSAQRRVLRGPNGGGGSASTAKLPSGRELLHASSFSLTHETPSGAFASVWGRGAYTSIEERKGALKVEGDVSTGQFGVDWSSGAWLLGLAAAHSLGESDYADTAFGDSGRIETALTGLYPYLGYRITERLSAWGTLGYGEASLTFKRQGRDEIKTDMDSRMGAAGLRGDLLHPGASGGFALSVRADAVFVRTRSDEVAGSLAATSNNTRRLRIGLESSHNIVFESGARFSPIIEIGVLHDDGDLEEGTGTDIEAGVLYAGVSGFSVDLRARSLLTHEVSGRKEWGVSGVLRYDPSPASQLGPAFSLKSGYGGSATGGVDEMFALRMSDGIDELGGDAPSAGRISAEVGYGIAVPGGRFTGTPWARFGLTEGRPSWRLGWRFTPLADGAPDLRTGIEFGDREGGHELRLKLDTRF